MQITNVKRSRGHMIIEEVFLVICIMLMFICISGINVIQTSYAEKEASPAVLILMPSSSRSNETSTIQNNSDLASFFAFAYQKTEVSWGLTRVLHTTNSFTKELNYTSNRGNRSSKILTDQEEHTT
jgi:hypothetical protein